MKIKTRPKVAWSHNLPPVQSKARGEMDLSKWVGSPHKEEKLTIRKWEMGPPRCLIKHQSQLGIRRNKKWETNNPVTWPTAATSPHGSLSFLSTHAWVFCLSPTAPAAQTTSEALNVCWGEARGWSQELQQKHQDSTIWASDTVGSGPAAWVWTLTMSKTFTIKQGEIIISALLCYFET